MINNLTLHSLYYYFSVLFSAENLLLMIFDIACKSGIFMSLDCSKNKMICADNTRNNHNNNNNWNHYQY